MNTNSEQADLGRCRLAQAQTFRPPISGQSDLIAVVVDGATPELAEAGASAAHRPSAPEQDPVSGVRRPDGGAFFDHNGMLFLPLTDVQATTQQLFKAQPFLGALAADPSLRGMMDSLSTALMGVTRSGQAFRPGSPMSQFGDSFGGRRGKAGRISFLARADHRREAGREEMRRFIEVQPTLFYDRSEPGLRASDAIRAAAAQLGLTAEMACGCGSPAMWRCRTRNSAP